MVINQQLQYLLSLDSENEIVEFKEAKTQFDFNKLGKYFSALSNEANLAGVPSAWLVFGVNNQRNVVGSKYRTNPVDLHHLKAEIANHTSGRITLKEIHEVATENGRVVLMELPPAPAGMPIAWKGHYYGRDHEELNALNMVEFERIRSQAAIDWSSEICHGAHIEDLSGDAILKARELYSLKNPQLENEISAWDEETFLNKAKLCVKGKVTRAAILLLGKPESAHYLTPANPEITWILKDKDNLEKDYEHFPPPFLLAVDNLFQKIRNLKYRYIRQDSLFPEEVDQYDSYLIREALNNCIAHQDYTLGGKIVVVEREDSHLIFSNKGQFIPASIESVIEADAPESQYRNTFLTRAMVSLNMIDTIGSGIKKMFMIQRNKFFPLPEYDLENRSVKVTLIGKVLDINYARKLAQGQDLSLTDIMLLDRVQKKLDLTSQQARYLKGKGWIEGRKPNYFVSARVANVTGQKADYIKNRGIEDDYCRKLIVDYLNKFKSATRNELEQFLLDKLPDVLDEKQKKDKVKNNLQKLRKNGVLSLGEGKKWLLSKAGS